MRFQLHPKRNILPCRVLDSGYLDSVASLDCCKIAATRLIRRRLVSRCARLFLYAVKIGDSLDNSLRALLLSCGGLDMLAVACGVDKYGLYQQRLAFTRADKTEIIRAVCRIDFDLCAPVADAESVGYTLADCSGELFAGRALVLVIDLRASAA